MAMKDCIRRLEKAGKPLTPKQHEALQEALNDGLTEDQAVRRVALMAHQNVIDIASRAQEEGATVAPLANPVSDIVQFQSKALTKLNDLTEETNKKIADKAGRFTDITSLEGWVRTLRTPSGVLTDIDSTGKHVWIDLNNDKQVLDAMVQLTFNPDKVKNREKFGLTGESANEMFDSFRALQAEKQQLIEEIHELANILNEKQRKVDTIFHGAGKQTFDQSDIPKLTVRHNISAANLIHADNLGGLAVPSLAVLPEDQSFTGFGEISFIGTDELADPEQMPIFDADGYTIRFPTPEYKPAPAKLRDAIVMEMVAWERIWGDLASGSYYVERHLRDHPNPQLVIWKMMDSDAVKAWYLSEVWGEELTPKEKDVRPQFAWGWDDDVIKFFTDPEVLEASNAQWDSPKRRDMMKRAGDVALKASMRSMMARDKNLTEDQAHERATFGALLDNDGSITEARFRQLWEDAKRKGTRELDDVSNHEMLQARLDNNEAMAKIMELGMGSEGAAHIHFKSWIEEKVGSSFGEPRLKLNGKWVEYNLENITRKMKGNLRGTEEGFGQGDMNEGLMRALASHRFKKLEEMRAQSETKIGGDVEEIKVLREASRVALANWTAQLSQFYTVENEHGYVDSYEADAAGKRAIVRWITKSGDLATANDLEAALEKEGFDVSSDFAIPLRLIDEGMEAAMTWMAVPVPYFESKPQRSVMLEEFAGAVIPSDASPQTQAILRKRRIPFKMYQVGDNIDEKQSRTDATNEFTQQLNNQGERTLFQSDIGLHSGLLTAAKVMPQESGSAEQMLATLRKQPNVKKQEMDYLGVEEWAEAMGSFTRDQLVKFLEEGGVQLEETYYQGEEKRDYSLAHDQVELSEEFWDQDVEDSELSSWFHSTKQYDVYDRTDAFAEHYTVLVDEDAGNVSVRKESTGEWLDVDGATNAQALIHGVEAVEKVIRRQNIDPDAVGPTKWTNYTLDGGENHREIVLHTPEVKLPPITMESLSENTDIDDTGPMGIHSLFHLIDHRTPDGRRIQVYQIPRSKYATFEEAKQYIIDEKQPGLEPGKNFKSHAFPQQNIIAWMRVNDREGPNGEKILFVDETQSDLHQAGLTDGYTYTTEQIDRAQREFEEIEVKTAKMLQNLDEPFVGYDNGRVALNEWMNIQDEPLAGAMRDPFESLTKKQRAMMNSYSQVRRETALIEQGGSVPNMPWKGDAWAELAMKRIIRLAVEGGYDQVAWTTGEQQVERYDIDDYFDEINWDPRDQMLTMYDDNGRLVNTEWKSQEDLEELFGAERVAELNRQINTARRRYDVVAIQTSDVVEAGSNTIVVDIDDPDIGPIEREWLEDGGEIYGLMDQNGEMVRQSGGAFQAWEYYDGAQEGLDDWAFADELPTLTGVDVVDEEGSGLRQRYDKLLVNVTNRALKKLDKSAKVGRYEKFIFVEGVDTGVHGFDITPQIMTAAMEGQTYFQKNRGQITFDEENAAIIRLSKAKDLSTFLHESAHLYLELMGDMVDVTHVDPKLIDDYATILKFLGVNNRYEIETRHHELFARSFEAYLREGKAPTAELQPVFSAYSGWLHTIYSVIRKLLRPHEKLNDEIRGVFDRIVASDQAISDSEDMMSYVQLYATAEEMGVSQEVFDVYKNDIQKEHDAEVDKLTRASLKSMRWAKEQWWKDERKKVAAEVRAEAEQMPVYRAMAMLMRGKNPDGSDPVNQIIKLDKADLISRYGKEKLKELPGRGRNLTYKVEGGTDADIAANIFGFEDGDAMIEALVNAPKMEQFIKDEADVRMKELHPDPLNDPELLEETTKQVHTTKRAQILGKELRALRKKMAEDKAIVKATKDEAKRTDKQAMEANKGQLPKRENMATIKAAAAALIAKKRIRDIQPHRYLQAERKAGRLAFQAMERKDYEEAYAQKLAQIMNFEAYRAALKAKEQSARDHKYLVGFNKASKATRMAKAGYLERIHAVLEGIDLRRISMKQVDREKLENELMEAIQSGDIVTTPEIMSMLDNPGGINWKDMTFEQFAGIRDVVKQLEHQARTDYEIIINGEKKIIQDAIDEVAAGIIENNEQVPRILTSEKGGGIRKGFRDAASHWLRSSSIARVLDKSGFGAVTRNVIVPIRRAMTEKLMPTQHQASLDVAERYKKHYSDKELTKLGKKLPGKIMGQSWAKSDILALALHWGTESGRAAVLGGILEDAYGNRSQAYTEEGVASALALMDKRDWAFVQDIWDYQESYWTQLKETEERRRGIAPQKVESLPFEIRTVDGEMIHLKGGYHHLQYMRDTGGAIKDGDKKSGRDVAFDDAYDKMQKGGFISASTRAGATYNRTQNHGRVIHLTLNTIDQNLREILRDMAIGDEVNLVNRILQSKEVRNAATNTNNTELLTELKLWLSDAAVGELPAQSSWEKAVSWFRVGFTKSKLAFNVYVTLLQLTGAFQSMATIGTQQYMRGFGKFLQDPVGNWKMVQEKSTFMAARYGVMQAFDKDVADTKAFLTSFFGGVPTKFARSMDTMAHYYFMPIAKFQQFVDTTTWMAAYEQGMNDPKVKTEEEARYYADAQVERAQTSGIFSDRSGLERGTLGTRTRQGQFVRLWTVLISYMLAKGNIAYEKTKMTDFKDPKQAAFFLSDMVLLFAVEGMASALLYGDWPEEDDEGDKNIVSWGASATLESIASGVPMVREYSGAKYGSGTTPIGALTVDLFKALEQIGQLEADEAAMKSIVKATGTMFHLPASQTNRFIEALFKEEDTELHEWFLGVDEDE